MKKLAFAAISIGLGVITALALVYTAGKIAIWMGMKERGDSEPEFAVAAPRTADLLPTQIPVSMPAPTGHSFPYESRAARTVYPPGYSDRKERRPWPGRYKISQFDNVDGTLNYEIEVQVDDRRRRKTYGQDDPSREIPFLTFGCSFTFGDGLAQDETLASQLARIHPKYRVYNYGFSGADAGAALSLARADSFASDISPKPGGKAIFLFMNHHLSRLVGALDIYYVDSVWARTLPNYALARNGDVVLQGSHSEAHPIRHAAFTILGYFDLLRLYGVQIPKRFDGSHRELFAGVMRALQDELKKKLQMDFFVVFGMGASLSRELIPSLDRLGVRSIDYSGFKFEELLNAPPTLRDGHPSAELNRFLAERMTRDLRL